MIDFRKLNPAEKRLLAGFAGVVVFLVHLFGLRFIWHQAQRLGTEASLRRAEKEMVEALLADSEIWQPREAWLLRQLPPKTASTRKVLDEKVEAVGKEFSLNSPRGQTIEETGQFYDAEHYTTSLSGRWPDLIQALQKLYLPQEAIAVTSLEIKAVDEKTHNANVTVSRFFLRGKEGGSP
jgi:hypothetical protein